MAFPSRLWPTDSAFARPSSAPRLPRPAGSSGLRTEARPTAGTSAELPNPRHRRPARAEHWPRLPCHDSRPGSQQCDETTDDAFAHSNMNSLAWLNPSRQDATAKLPFVYDPQSGIGFEGDINVRHKTRWTFPASLGKATASRISRS